MIGWAGTALILDAETSPRGGRAKDSQVSQPDFWLASSAGERFGR